MRITDPDSFAHRYVAMWNEPEHGARRSAIIELFAPGAVHYTPTREVHGHAEMESRVRGSYEQWVKPGVHFFRAAGADAHHDAVRLTWEMVSAATGEIASVGTDFIVVDATGRILADYQFIVS
ncbi:nuclear transport factor 2 family protein [Embleya sp. NPDC050154]|uniref:nuclear transport factor 2 family protein n=1 Tax=unclassified Embleya TaxID=2699296 RepID=UPI0037A9AE5D